MGGKSVSGRMIERVFNRYEAPERAEARGFVRLLGRQNSTLLLLLSLNLLLIVFFVVLNANADVDWQRSRVILSSVQKSFGDDANRMALNANAPAKIMAQDALRSTVSAAFVSVLDGKDVLVRNEADRFIVSVPMAALFETDTGKLRAVLPVLDRIAAGLKNPFDGYRYEMIVTVHALGASEDAMIQASVLAEDLLRRDFGPTLFAVGLAPSLAPGVTFTFQVLSDSAAEQDEVSARGGT